MDTEDRIVTLIDEEGQPFEFVVIDLFAVEEQEYAIMVPLQGDKLEAAKDEEDESAVDELDDFEDFSFDTDEAGLDEEEAVIFRLFRNEEGETSFELIENEEEWEKVSAVAFERLYQAEEE